MDKYFFEVTENIKKLENDKIKLEEANTQLMKKYNDLKERYLNLLEKYVELCNKKDGKINIIDTYIQ